MKQFLTLILTLSFGLVLMTGCPDSKKKEASKGKGHMDMGKDMAKDMKKDAKDMAKDMKKDAKDMGMKKDAKDMGMKKDAKDMGMKKDAMKDKKMAKVSDEDKKAVQAVMKAYVEAKLKKDKDVYMIKHKGKDLKGKYDYLHGGVKMKDGNYVSCADVKVGKDIYDIDFVVKKEGDKYVVKKEFVHKINGKKVE